MSARAAGQNGRSRPKRGQKRLGLPPATSMQHPVVVIGAGFSGVTAVKACLEEGLPVVCLEKSGSLGGLWRFRQDDVQGMPSVMRSTIIDTSKEMGAFSDFPPRPQMANYMHNSLVLQYLEEYASHFGVDEHIRFRHDVVEVRKAEDFDASGVWDVRVENAEGQEVPMKASHVMVCTGHHVFPHEPRLPGLDTFKGQVLHSHSYKDWKGFEGKRVVIVGAGNSAMDIAVELSRVASTVYLSTRRGTWILPRLGPKGVPLDLCINTRLFNALRRLLPTTFTENTYMKQLNQRFDHAKYMIRPEHGPFAQHPTVSDELPSRILAGAVVVKGDVASFQPHGVVFAGDGTGDACPVDAVVLATGYRFRFPFLSEEVVRVQDNQVMLYKRVFPVGLKPHTLSFIGLVQPIGAIFPISELQARWVVRVAKGISALPSRRAMVADWTKDQERIRSRFVHSQRHTIEVDFIPYMDEIAELVGVRPNLVEMAYKDPKFFWKCMYGPCVPYQYRLRGPHAWPGARRAVESVWHRVFSALDTKDSESAARMRRLAKPTPRGFLLPCVLLLCFFYFFLL